MSAPPLRDRAGNDEEYRAPRLEISLKDFELTRVLGEGSMSTVVEARWKERGELYALKIIDKFFIQRHKMTDAVVRERSVMDRLNSDLTVRLRFTFQDAHKLYMAMDICPNGDLFDQLQARRPLPVADVKQYAAEIVLILEHLRERKVLYRDLKPENLLLDANGHLKLADFGTARFAATTLPETFAERPADCASTTGLPAAVSPASVDKAAVKRSVSFVGTADYVAPEILSNTSCGYSVDLWGFGCLLFQMFAGKPPFRDKSEYLTFQRISDRQFTFPNGFPPDAQDLVDRLLHMEPSERIGAASIDELKAHAFFQGIEWSEVRDKAAPEFVKTMADDVCDADRWEMQSLMDSLAASTCHA